MSLDIPPARLFRSGGEWLLAFGVPLFVLIWSITTFLNYPPDDDPFPYFVDIPAFFVSLTLLIIAVRQRYPISLSPFVRRSGKWALVAGLLGAAAVSAALWIDAGYQVRHSEAITRTLAASSTSEVSVSTAMRDATVAMEDRVFYEHNGFDWAAMHRALRVNWRAGRTKQGGSTITQQLAKVLFLTNNRTLGRKLQEAPLAIALERNLTKDQILSLYLQSIEYGMGQRGIARAARFYFHTTPDKLTLAQSAILVGLVPYNPQKMPSQRNLTAWRDIALGRVRTSFSERYSDREIELAQNIPVNHLVYPYRLPYDVGASEQIPPGWLGVLWFSYVSATEPRTVPNVSPLLKRRLEAFVLEARRRYSVVAIDHLGVYADRAQRDAPERMSAHAYGQAIDIAGFRFADGTRISVRDHGMPETASRLAPLRALLQRHFDHIVDWTNEPRLHQDHIHAEVRGPRPALEKTGLPSVPEESTMSSSKEAE